MTWTYRVIKTVHPSGEEELNICEVYLNEKGEIDMYSDGCAPHGETLEELRDDLASMARALMLPVLTQNDLPG